MKLKNNESGFGHIEILIVVVVLAVIGFGAWRVLDANDTSSDAQASISSEDESSRLDELPTDLSTIKPIEEIQSLVAAEAGDKNIVKIKLEAEDGQTIYVVYLSDGSRMAYDAFTGEVVQLSNDEGDDQDEDGESIPADFTAGISLQQAIAIAVAERPNSTLEKVELEVEDGIVVYSVRFTDDSRVDVNAANGTIQRLKDEAGVDVIKLDDDFDDDGIDNPEDEDDDNDGIRDTEDSDDDNDGVDDEEDDDDDNDGREDEEDDDDDERDDEERDNSGSGSNNSGSGRD